MSEKRLPSARDVEIAMRDERDKRARGDYDNIPSYSPTFSDKSFQAYKDAEKTEKAGDYDEASRLYGQALNLARVSTVTGFMSGQYVAKETRVKMKEKRDKAIARTGGKDITQTLSAIIGISGIAISIFFLSNNITGNVIGSLNISTSNVIGAILLLVGLVGAFFWFRKK